MWELSQSRERVCASRQTNQAEVCTIQLVRCHLLCSRPTHDQIEQLQSKVNDLEDLLRAVTGTESGNATEALRTRRHTGSTNAHVSSSSSKANPNASIDASASDEGNDETGAAFDTPPSDQYIYDTTG